MPKNYQPDFIEERGSARGSALPLVRGGSWSWAARWRGGWQGWLVRCRVARQTAGRGTLTHPEQVSFLFIVVGYPLGAIEWGLVAIRMGCIKRITKSYLQPTLPWDCLSPVILCSGFHSLVSAARLSCHSGIWISPIPSVLLTLSQSQTCSTTVFLMTSAKATWTWKILPYREAKPTLNWKDSLKTGLNVFLIVFVLSSSCFSGIMKTRTKGSALPRISILGRS